MNISFTKMETAKILGLNTVDVDQLCRSKVLHSWFREDRDGRYSLHIDAKDVLDYAKNRDGEHYIAYIKPKRPKTIKIRTLLEFPDEWYDEDYQKVVQEITKIYEQQKLEDLY